MSRPFGLAVKCTAVVKNINNYGCLFDYAHTVSYTGFWGTKVSYIGVGTAAAGAAMAAALFDIKLLIFMIFTLYQ